MIKNSKKYNKGELSFGMEIIIFLVLIFIIWVFMGGAEKPVEEKPFVVPYTDTVNGGAPYGFTDVNN